MLGFEIDDDIGRNGMVVDGVFYVKAFSVFVILNKNKVVQ